MLITPHELAPMLRGRFVVLDGPDGSGKSTQFRRLVDYAQDGGLEVCEVRDPGGTAIGEQIRHVLLDPAHHEMDLRCEMLLYMASRAQLVAQRIRPARERGHLVLADRFISSTLAYQGAAGGIPTSDILTVGHLAVGDCWPDLIIVFDVDEQTAAGRMSRNRDRIEQKGIEYHRTVRRGYLDQVHADPEHYILIDASPDAQTVFEHMVASLAQRLG